MKGCPLFPQFPRTTPRETPRAKTPEPHAVYRVRFPQALHMGVGAGQEGEGAARTCLAHEPAGSDRQNRRFCHVSAGHAGHCVIRDTSPEQLIAAQTANELACSSWQARWEFVRAKLLGRSRLAEAAKNDHTGDQSRTSPLTDSALSEMSPELCCLSC